MVVQTGNDPNGLQQVKAYTSCGIVKQGVMAWMFVLPQTHMLKFSPPMDGIREWGLWEVTRSQGWCSPGWDWCPYKRVPYKESLLICLLHVRME